MAKYKCEPCGIPWQYDACGLEWEHEESEIETWNWLQNICSCGHVAKKIDDE